jgi:hypothetical protein
VYGRFFFFKTAISCVFEIRNIICAVHKQQSYYLSYIQQHVSANQDGYQQAVDKNKKENAIV